MRTTLGDYRTKMANEEKKLKFGNKSYGYEWVGFPKLNRSLGYTHKLNYYYNSF